RDRTVTGVQTCALPIFWSLTTSAVYRLYAQALAECNAVIIFSDLQREILVSLGVPREVIQVLPNGVDVDKYAPGESAKRAHFNEIGRASCRERGGSRGR